jgi:hypothetical protein
MTRFSLKRLALFPLVIVLVISWDRIRSFILDNDRADLAFGKLFIDSPHGGDDDDIGRATVVGGALVPGRMSIALDTGMLVAVGSP